MNRGQLVRVGKRLAFVMMTFAAAIPTRGDDPDATTRRRADQERLKPLASLVGGWRGTGQVVRNSARDAWTESSAWSWKLGPGSAALEATVERGKHLKSFAITPGADAGTFVLTALLPDGTRQVFKGRAGTTTTLGKTSASIVFQADDPTCSPVDRITLSPLHETRYLLLLESQSAETKRYIRLGEVGYTRQGVAFAVGESGPICIVTEGRGTIPVTHKGKTYYVCCSGCKDLFLEDPEAILAEAAQREAKGTPGK